MAIERVREYFKQWGLENRIMGHTENLAKEQAPSMQQELLDKHFLRKHGANAYYGQK